MRNTRNVSQMRLLVLIGIRQRIEELDQLLPDLDRGIQAVDVVSEALQLFCGDFFHLHEVADKRKALAWIVT